MIFLTQLHFKHKSPFSDTRTIQQKLYYHLYILNVGSNKINEEGATVTIEASYTF